MMGGNPILADRLAEIDGNRVFVLANGPGAPVDGGKLTYLSQKDIRALQLAKGAIRTAYTMLLERLGLTGENLEEIILCGAFGTYMNQNHAKRIGLIPDFAGVPVRSVGNAAGAGARMCLISGPRHAAALKLATHIEHVEMSTDECFSRIFMHALNF